MASTGQNFTLYEGEDKNLAFTVTGIDVTTATAIVWVAHSPGGAFVTKTLADAEIAQTSSTVATVTILPADFDGIPEGDYNHQLWITNSSSKASLVAEGKITFKKDYRA